MQASLYVTLSAQMALEQRLNTVATNVANLGTAGYRAEEVKFETILSEAGGREVAFTTPGETFLSRKAGPLIKTDSPLDVGVQGDGWLAVRGPGGPVYTRDGRMQVTAAGDLQDLSGRPILDPGGSPLTVDPEGPPITIGQDGIISQGTNQIGALGVFRLDPAAKLTRVAGGAVASDRPGQPILDFNQRDATTVRVQQGFQEGANVNPVMEMSRLIEITRTFQNAAAAVAETESSLQDAIRGLGPSAYGKRAASPRDYRTVVLSRPGHVGRTRFMAEIGELQVQPDIPAKVVIDQRTGTVVIGRNVQVSTVAVTHGDLTVRITETPQVSQPAPFSDGQTTVVPRNRSRLEALAGSVKDGAKVDLEPQISEIEQLVASAAGFNKGRGDQIKVAAVSFIDEGQPLAPTPALGVGDVLMRQSGTLINAATILIVGCLLIWFGLRPAVNAILARPSEVGTELTVAPMDLAAALGVSQAEQVGASSDPSLIEDLNEHVARSPIRKLEQLVELDEEQVANILKQWLTRDEAA